MHAHDGDVYARYRVRMDEMRESMKIIRQALAAAPAGPTGSRLPRCPPRATWSAMWRTPAESR